MTILDEIIANKKKELESRKLLAPIHYLEKSIYFERPSFSLRNNLARSNTPAIIAEFKRKSPSKGIINDKVQIEPVTKAYCEAGAVGLSVLTDEVFFGGTLEDLLKAGINSTPLLQKDFMVDEYQVVEAKSHGADVILLIAEILTVEQGLRLAKLARSLGLEVLLEIHGEDQLKKVNPYLDIIGVNNRDLRTFEVDIETSVNLFEKIPDDFIKISESGISSVENIQRLHQVGFKGFLVGENFMKTKDPGEACMRFIGQL